MYLTFILILLTSVFSYLGFKDELFMDRFSFRPHRIKNQKEYIRFLTSGLLHVSWGHLIINMLVLFGFGNGLEILLGVFPFLFLYLGSLVGGNLFAYWIHRHHNRYNSVGASGAVSGLVFATIALNPAQTLFLGIPMWFVGLAYVAVTVYAIRSQRRDVGHAAHLGGGLVGMFIALAFRPHLLAKNGWYILAIILPAIALMVILIYRPDLILVDKNTQKKQLSQEDHFNMSRADQRKAVDKILEKINEKGMGSLTKKEKEILDAYSKS
jgi:membrane associated rhomboid family serine protease